MAYSMRSNAAAMVQVHRDLEDAAALCGANWFQRTWRLVLPLISPGLVAGWMYVFIVSFRELTTTAMLYSSSSQILAIQLFDYYKQALLPEAAALGLMMILVLFVLSAVLRRLVKLDRFLLF